MYGIHGKKYTLHQFDLPQISNFIKEKKKKVILTVQNAAFIFVVVIFI